MPAKLNTADLQAAAKTLGCQVALIQAFAWIESRNSGFTADGNPRVRLEARWFKYYDPQKRTVTGTDYAAFKRAYALNPYAALMGSSWGEFQIMGFNHGICGYSTVFEFETAMRQSEVNHLKAFVAFIKAKKLQVPMAKLQFKVLALTFNGNNYAQNKYDTTLEVKFIDFGGIIDPAVATANADEETAKKKA